MLMGNVYLRQALLFYIYIGGNKRHANNRFKLEAILKIVGSTTKRNEYNLNFFCHSNRFQLEWLHRRVCVCLSACVCVCVLFCGGTCSQYTIATTKIEQQQSPNWHYKQALSQLRSIHVGCGWIQETNSDGNEYAPAHNHRGHIYSWYCVFAHKRMSFIWSGRFWTLICCCCFFSQK